MKKYLRVLFALVLALSMSLMTAVPVMAATTYYVTTGGNDGNDGSSGSPWLTIQHAIDTVSATDTIIVGDGTYTEDLDPGATSIETANLTVRSVNGPASTTIQLVDGVGVDLGGGANNFTLGGAAGQGFTILSGAGTTFNIQLANAPSGVTISHNTINTTGNATQGISIGSAGSTGLTISNNAFTAAVGDISIYGPYHVNLTVSDTTSTGPGRTNNGGALQFPGVTGTSVISGNIITGYGRGISITNGSGVSGLTISGNTISGCFNGIDFLEYNPSAPPAPGNITTVTVVQNTLSSNTNGIKVYDSTYVLASNFTINFNNFTGNTAYGLLNAHTTQPVTAEDNWWFHSSGPYHATTNPFGAGDTVSDNVDYTPWLGGLTSFTPSAGTLVNLTSVAEASLPTAGKPNLVFPYGFFAFDIIGLTNGQQVTVTIVLPGAVPAGSEYWKYHIPEGWIQIPMTSNDGDNVIIITLVDGGLGDDDGAANGTIEDQGGPGFASVVGGTVYPVNKLSILAPWLGLALILAVGGGMLLMRRRQTIKS